MDDRHLASVLLDDYNYWRSQTKSAWDHSQAGRGYLAKPLKALPERIELFRQLVVWCREQRLEPRLWLFVLFRSRKWLYNIKCEPGSLMSKNCLRWYRKPGPSLGFFRGRVRASAETNAQPDPNRDLIPTVEAKKRVYLAGGNAALCRQRIVQETLGFHPSSHVCVVCPEQRACAIKLQGFVRFDVQALRLGRISAEEAEESARL